MKPILFQPKDTKQLQYNVRELFAQMTPDFRDYLMHSFLWSQDKLETFLNSNVELSGDELQDAYSHLDSLLSRIESFAAEHSDKEFPSYEHWVDQEYEKYKSSLQEDKEDIERLMDEGGVVAPGKTSPVDTMANDSLSHYNHVKEEFDKKQKRGNEAVAMMRSPAYINLQKQAAEMSEAIISGIRMKS